MRILSNLKSFNNYFDEPSQDINRFWSICRSEHVRFAEVDLPATYRNPHRKVELCTQLSPWFSYEDLITTVKASEELQNLIMRGELFVETCRQTKSIKFYRIRIMWRKPL